MCLIKPTTKIRFTEPQIALMMRAHPNCNLDHLVELSFEFDQAGVGDEIRALRRLQREQGLSSHVFMSERDGPMTPKAFHALFGRIGSRAKMQFPIHPHMLRHGCGYALANAGHDTRALQAWLGHRNIQHTVRYTELAPDRFKNFWRD